MVRLRIHERSGSGLSIMGVHQSGACCLNVQVNGPGRLLGGGAPLGGVLKETAAETSAMGGKLIRDNMLAKVTIIVTMLHAKIISILGRRERTVLAEAQSALRPQKAKE